MTIDSLPTPPPDLMIRVTGQDNPEAFDRSGVETVQDYTAAIDRPWSDFRSVLDFGAGCGRVLRHLAPLLNRATIAAADIDGPAIAWLASAMPAVRTVTSGHEPPLPYADGSFDLIYAHSVFSHLPEDMQDRWLAELARVLAPGGTLLASVHGPQNWERHTRPILETHPGAFDVSEMGKRLYRYGHLYFTGDGWEQHFPDAPYYHTAWHHPVYVWSRWSRWFDVQDVREGGARPSQDLVVLRKH